MSRLEEMTTLGPDLGINVTMVVISSIFFVSQMSRLEKMTTLGSDLGVNVSMVVNILYILCFTDESPRGHDHAWT